ncbi:MULTISPECIES: response regulator transcription factor [unclassified Bradyrhizobium]|uniref:response regulator transcription factor n=1 Tax=unclassified Bradyrhizobium TaxID=2631580 RepID=UPI0028F1429F|nr:MULTISPECIES: LuxR C-terminal-related transcriptional regulator [unclassified Bradyrhizobium]
MPCAAVRRRPIRNFASLTAASAHLTAREQLVVGLIVEGLTSKQIARRLAISPLTVRKHRENVMRKLGVHSLAELVRVVRTLGIAPTPSEVYRGNGD